MRAQAARLLIASGGFALAAALAPGCSCARNGHKGSSSGGDMGVAAKGWMTAADDRVCPTICEPNGIEGAIPLDAAFTSGDTAPPGHPLCRCALDAADLPATDLDLGDLS